MSDKVKIGDLFIKGNKHYRILSANEGVLVEDNYKTIYDGISLMEYAKVQTMGWKLVKRHNKTICDGC